MRSRIDVLAAGWLALALPFVTGCNIVGPLGYLASGPDKAPAQYELPEQRPTIVFIDDRGSVLPTRTMRRTVAKAAERVMLDSGAVPKGDILSSDAIAGVQVSERFSRPRSIAEVGREVRAEVVVYATIDQFTLSGDGVSYAPVAGARVKVIDAKDDKRLWPESPTEWTPLSVTVPTTQTTLPTRSADRDLVQQQLAERLGVALGQLFVKHAAREANPRIGR
jgi:hypothetical protein